MKYECVYKGDSSPTGIRLHKNHNRYWLVSK
jgi:hypothetical protein